MGELEKQSAMLALAANRDSVASRTGALLVIPAGKTPEHADLGSAVVLDVAGRLIAVTAAHVVGGQSGMEVVLTRHGAPHDELRALSRRAVHRGGGGDFDGYDLAFFELQQDEAEWWRVQSTPIESTLLEAPDPGQFVLLCGFPKALARVDRDGDRLSFSLAQMVIGGPVAAEDAFSSRHVRGQNLLVRATKQVLRAEDGRLELVDLPPLKGISGGGIWQPHAGPDRVFPPRTPLLVGIEFGVLAEQQLIVGNTLAPVLVGLWRHLPNLRPELDRTFPGAFPPTEPPGVDP